MNASSDDTLDLLKDFLPEVQFNVILDRGIVKKTDRAVIIITL